MRLKHRSTINIFLASCSVVQTNRISLALIGHEFTRICGLRKVFVNYIMSACILQQ
jgi:hypothetical protein